MSHVLVLLSSYNGEKYIQEQLHSILNQTGCDVHILIRDDGSTDKTLEIIASFCRQYENIALLPSEKNLGAANSFMTLIRNAPQYDYYALADQDDIWDPDKLQAGIAALSEHSGPALYFANARLVDKDCNYLGRDAYKRIPPTDFYSLVCGGCVLGCTVVFNHALAAIMQTHPVPETMVMHDKILSIVCTLYDGIVIYDSRPHMQYRQHGKNVVGTNWTKAAALKDRWKRITTKAKVSIADQAQSVYESYSDAPNAEKLSFLRFVASYPLSIFSTIALAFSPKPKYNGKNAAFTLRLAILLRKH